MELPQIRQDQKVMPKYRATLQLSGIAGDSPRAVRSTLDEQLRSSGLANCQVVSIDIDAPIETPTGPRQRSVEGSAWQSQTNLGGLLLVSAAAWAVWFFWWMLSATPE